MWCLFLPVFTFVYGDTYCEKWYFSRNFTLSVTSLLFVLPLCFPKRIDFLKYARCNNAVCCSRNVICRLISCFSAVGVVAIVYCVLLVTIKYFVGPNHPGTIKTKSVLLSIFFLIIVVIKKWRFFLDLTIGLTYLLSFLLYASATKSVHLTYIMRIHLHDFCLKPLCYF